MWDVKRKKLIQRYQGHKQSRFVVRSCFGGANQAFIASGSEGNNTTATLYNPNNHYNHNTTLMTTMHIIFTTYHLLSSFAFFTRFFRFTNLYLAPKSGYSIGSSTWSCRYCQCSNLESSQSQHVCIM